MSLFENLTVVRTDRELECPILDASLRNGGANLILLEDGISDADLIEAVQDADILLMCYTPITRRVIESASRLRGIVKYGVGIDAIDIKAAIDHNVSIANIPEYGENTVAEGAFSLLLSLSKRLIPLHQAMQDQGWLWPNANWLANDIAGKTLGIVGAGKIGRALARMAGPGFGARVLAYDPGVNGGELQGLGIEKVDDLHQMLAQCDFVSMHAVLNESSSSVIGEAEFAAMKDGVIFINVARGALVDEQALLQALNNGKVGAAGLDVFRQEPVHRDGHPLSSLYGRDNVILTPHLTFYTAEAMQRLETETLERCAELATGQALLVKSSDPRLRQQTNGVRFAPT